MLEINTLSSPEIVVGNEKVTEFVSRKALALVIYLAINPGSRSREELADLLWSDRSQERATGNLRVVLSDVRKKIGDYLSIDRHSVAISASGDIWVDVHQLSDAIETKNLDLAVSLYKGDFLESFYLRGASRFENWQVIEREKIRLELVDGLSETIYPLLKAGKSKGAIKYLKHLLSLEPLLESAHRQLMQAYFENGEVSLALRQFEICKQTLFEELSVTPAEETLNLYIYIKGQRISEKNGSTTSHNLPNFTTPFIGQKEKTLELLEILSSSEVRHLSLVGPGGYGKSRLAIRLAKKCIDRFPDGVFWVPLQSLEKSFDLPTAIANAIGLIHQGDRDIKSKLLDYLGSRQTLLLLDNFEHLIEGGSLVSEILRNSQNVKVITTSRQKLNLKGETTYVVQGMDYPTHEEIDSGKVSTKRYDAIQLFIKSASRSSPSFKPNKEELETITRICRSVDGMPLAIELAAGWVPVLSLSEIEGEINKGFAFLEGNLQDVEERHQSLHAVAEGSWRMFTDAEKAVFKKLSIFKGPFTRRAAQAITGAKISDLLSLSNKSFLQKDSEGLLRVHEWLRQFGENQLRRSKAQYSETLETFSHYYVTYLSESWWEAWSGECQHLRLEWRNISRAFLTAARAGQFQLLKKGLVPCFFVSYIGEDFNNSANFFSQLVAEFDKRAFSENERETYALCLVFYSYFLFMQNKIAQVADIQEKVDDLLRECDQGSEYAWARTFQALEVKILGWERRIENANQALKIFTELGDEYALAFTYNFLGAWCFYGDTRKEYCQRALAIARKHHGTRDIAWALVGLGYSNNACGDFEKATDNLTEARSHFTHIGYQYGIIDASEQLGMISRKQKNYAQAKEYYEQALRLCDRVGAKFRMCNYKEGLGAVAVAMGDYKLGRQLILEATELAIETEGDNLPIWITPPQVSLLLEYLGNPELAVIVIVASINQPLGEISKLEYEELLEVFRAKYPQTEMSNWVEKGKQITPFELAVAIRDALSGD